MRVLITDSYDQMGLEAAKIVAGQIYLKPNSVLGLATGSTPLSMYERLVAVHRTVGLDFSEVTTFNLDEYIGMGPDNPQSYHYFMQEHFFKHINIKPENVHIPNGMAQDVIAEGERYEQLIAAKGGIDLQVLGIGQNAHIGFNEPDVKFAATTHKVELDEETILDNSRFFNNVDEVPRYAISMGIKTIMMAEHVVLLANGKNKARAVYKAVCGDVTPEAPASILQLHRDVVVILDKEAAELLPANFVSI
ncbi:glucosamine-6-phosphate deaminase [Anaerovibrio lipolyticus DSM 3074]|uniref:Glucosamine-6-phosphate deaminase n=2 Tax=Anaerovibrio lipolyticus TaxID=82374 RepID=A0A0B2JXN8_9FIRM|nr:glucosamine-6-phosphate deaminase [Anaerovibrio lipolyticus]KHM53075.1 glucosamine-6-phosphate deaminase [Anaerovibrio lipolyticus]SHI87844.1 glucosamine-6-phosphate deaminase [Anaerovibrio lipolyticus DSM 3074]